MSLITTKHESSAAFLDTKVHYKLLDGLRGAAALMVVWYHIFEGFAFASGTGIETFNHGHLGVDFFFMLSGFVISYAYDDRWQNKSAKGLSMKDFFKRRLIRLHPMIIMGAIIGCIAFLIGGGVKWDGSPTPLGWTMIAMVLGMLLIPAYPGAGYDVRGNGEMYSLNGPCWSLFFEYLGNLLYALFIRRLSNKGLFALTLITGVAWGTFAITNVSGYDMLGVGWTLDTHNFFGGLLRMLFPFTLGMFICRNFRPIRVRGIFWWSILVLFGLFSVPYISSANMTFIPGISWNSLFEFACILFVFPLIIWGAASGETTDKASTNVCRFLGDISYPLYIVHYPVMYLFYAWLIKNKVYTLSEAWPVALLVILTSVTLAYACLKLYDEPVRRFLAKKFK